MFLMTIHADTVCFEKNKHAHRMFLMMIFI